MHCSEFDRAYKLEKESDLLYRETGCSSPDVLRGGWFMVDSFGHVLMRLFEDEELYKACKERYDHYKNGDWDYEDGKSINPKEGWYVMNHDLTENGKGDHYLLHDPSYLLSDSLYSAADIYIGYKTNRCWDVDLYRRDEEDVINECKEKKNAETME